jgi:hypothetical protein
LPFSTILIFEFGIVPTICPLFLNLTNSLSIMDNNKNWIDQRFPLTKVWNEHLAEYYTPRNFNFC